MCSHSKTEYKNGDLVCSTCGHIVAKKHSKEWVRLNPEQSAADIERMHTGITEALRLIRTAGPGDHAEALIWLHNASQI